MLATMHSLYYAWLSKFPYNILPKLPYLKRYDAVEDRSLNALIRLEQPTAYKVAVMKRITEKLLSKQGIVSTIHKKHLMQTYIDWLLSKGLIYEFEKPILYNIVHI